MMKRRTFLGMTVGALASAASGAAGAGIGVSVTGFGADPSGSGDSTAAFRRAIDRLSPQGAVLEIPKGTYRFAASREVALRFTDLTDAEVRGNGSLFLFDGDTSPIAVNGCRGLTLRDFAIDWSTLPFAQGTVTEASGTAFTIAIDPGFSVAGRETIQAFADYDRRTRLPLQMDVYGSVASLRATGPQLLQVTLTKPHEIAAGTALVLRKRVYGINGIALSETNDTRISNVSLYAMPGMGLVAGGSRNIALDNFQTVIRPGTNRLMSLCADGVHLSDCAGTIDIGRCTFFGMGDDAININATFFAVKERIDARSVSVGGREGIREANVPRAGAKVQVCDRVTQETLWTGTVAKRSADERGGMARLTFTEDLSAAVQPGTVLCDNFLDTRTVIHDCKFLGNRARGALVHANTLITRNVFRGCSLPAVLASSDTERWMEGPPMREIRIEGNAFAGNNYARGSKSRGTITITAGNDNGIEDESPKIVGGGFAVENNKFEAPVGLAIFCAGVRDVTIGGNGLSPSSVILKNVDGASVKES